MCPKRPSLPPTKSPEIFALIGNEVSPGKDSRHEITVVFRKHSFWKPQLRRQRGLMKGWECQKHRFKLRPQCSRLSFELFSKQRYNTEFYSLPVGAGQRTKESGRLEGGFHA